jgi:hypothetical protein
MPLAHVQLRTDPTINRLIRQFAVQDTRVRFNAADLVQTSVSRRHYDVTPDGQRFLMVQRADGARRGQVIVVENWAEEIRQKVRRYE